MLARLGNDSGGECGVAVAKRFRMPDSTAGVGGRNARTGNAAALNRSGAVPSNAPFWYSYEYGSAHFALLSTEHDLRKGSEQREVSFPPAPVVARLTSSLQPLC